VIRTAAVALAALIATPPLVTLLALGRLFRAPDETGGIYDRIRVWWSRLLLFVSGVRITVHGEQHIGGGQPRIFVCNHVSWFDVPAMAATLPRGKYIAKAELYRVPFFGWGMRLVGDVRIERENRKAAFASYEVAAARIRTGAPVVVFPEGTRGRSYALRPFKKGPFVLAIAAGVPIVPVLIHGTLDVLPKGSWLIRPGKVDLHFMEPVSTAGYSYEERDRLLSIVHERMAAEQRRLYPEHADNS
jgi:1-acyl-sn-glycerol-3-phosphate acyltransferase